MPVLPPARFTVLQADQDSLNLKINLFFNYNTKTMETQTAQITDSKLKDFFTDKLEDLLWAEKKLVKTLPKMQEAATSAELKDAFGNHLTQTQNHVTRLEQIFGIIGEDVDTTKCAAMAGIVDEGEDIIDDTEEGTAQRDVGLIFARQQA